MPDTAPKKFDEMFDDLDVYVAAPRVTDFAVSSDGTRAVLAVSTLTTDKTQYVSVLWDVDLWGTRVARRLTWDENGCTGPTFTSSGDLLFLRRTSAADDTLAVWCLPSSGGEARIVASRSASCSGVRAAASVDTFVVASAVHPSAHTEADDDRIRALRRDTEVDAVLHSGYPIRHWDHDLGPATPQLFVGNTLTDDLNPMRQISSKAGSALHEAGYAISDDGSFVVTTWTVPGMLATSRTLLARIDTASSTTTILVDDEDADLGSPAISPDGTCVAFVRESRSTPDDAPRITLSVYSFSDGTVTDCAPGWDRWPRDPVWMPDGSGVLVVADDFGRAPIFLVRNGTAQRLTDTDSAYSHVHVGKDGSIFALEASWMHPPHPVRIDAATAVTTLPRPTHLPVPTHLPPPAHLPQLPGVLTEIEAIASDGHRVRGWLAMPTDACDSAKAPLVLWIHGGPLSSWNTWSWRWNPWLLVAKGYAVLLPDPALSTGYGQDFVQRGWGRWGKEPFADLMAITDAAVELPEVDGSRTAAMGGSFGGYMANWVAGHTDRFDAIVSHAGLWALDQFGPTTDVAYYWQREMSPEMAVENSPHLYVADITTPMLVVHGDKDYRVPIGEGLRLWYELLSESGRPADDEGKTDHRLLYFPSENHWVLSPAHAKIWYQVVFTFLAEHVLGETLVLPETLG